MLTCKLADTGRSTTRLGYGCSSIMGGMGRAASLRTLEWAFDAGIRHFDVAPMYGYGEAEACLGEFIARHPNDVTVTTKYGIPPPARSGLMSVVRTVARPLLKAVPALKARAQRAAAATGEAPKRELSAAVAQASLEASLRHLRVERIHLFLLHDATPEEVRDSSLLEFLERAREDGKIGAFGVGTDRQHAVEIEEQSPEYAKVVQREWSVFDAVAATDRFRIHHRSLGDNLRKVQAYLDGSSEAMRHWSQEINTSLAAPGVLSRLMMRAALWANPQGIVLFSSKVKEHIQANADLARPSDIEDARAVALYRAVQRDLVATPQERAA
jgi:D-threo-aldose 1-dehydrogenase